MLVVPFFPVSGSRGTLLIPALPVSGGRGMLVVPILPVAGGKGTLSVVRDNSTSSCPLTSGWLDVAGAEDDPVAGRPFRLGRRLCGLEALESSVASVTGDSSAWFSLRGA